MTDLHALHPHNLQQVRNVYMVEQVNPSFDEYTFMFNDTPYAYLHLKSYGFTTSSLYTCRPTGVPHGSGPGSGPLSSLVNATVAS